jgi:hypothetical protein
MLDVIQDQLSMFLTSQSNYIDFPEVHSSNHFDRSQQGELAGDGDTVCSSEFNSFQQYNTNTYLFFKIVWK